MGGARIITLAVAAVVAIVLMVVVGRLISHKPAPVQVAAAPAKPMVNVIVAAHDLPIGERLTTADLSLQAWPQDSLNPSFITDGQPAQAQAAGATGAVATKTSQAANGVVNAVTGTQTPMDALVGAIVKSPIVQNEPVTNAKLVRGGQGGYMAVVLRPGMRAISVPITVTTSAGGFILPGDHVDLLQAGQVDPPGGGQKIYVSQTLLKNVRVLAIDQSSQPPKNGGQTNVGAVATLEVSPSDAELVALARARGEVQLALRSYADAGQPTSRNGDAAFKVGTVRIIRAGVPTDITVNP